MDFRLKECLNALGNNAKIIEDKIETELIINNLIKHFPMATWGRIDWRKIKRKFSINSEENLLLKINCNDIAYLNNIYRRQLIKSEDSLISILKTNNKSNLNDIFILWFDASMPIIKCNLMKILENIYDVVTVSSDTWLYCPLEGWVIELDHNGNSTLGFAEEKATTRATQQPHDATTK